VECFQAASIVCDDLPQQDNADLRRGRPSLHKQFSESTAQLAIIALIAYGYHQLPSLAVEYGGHYPDGKVLRLIDYVSQAIGMNGLTWGQVLDLDHRHPIRDIDQLKAATFLKTGLAFEASVYPAFILLGEPQSQRALAMKEFAREVGVIFQARDDYLDATQLSDHIGKSAGIDSRNGTKTYVTELGEDGVLNLIADSTFRALEHLSAAGLETEVLRNGVIGLARRSK
jgi:geranylgeranyl pyrophosphate synthase